MYLMGYHCIPALGQTRFNIARAMARAGGLGMQLWIGLCAKLLGCWFPCPVFIAPQYNSRNESDAKLTRPGIYN
jgi:hypothetical protein